MDELLQNLGKLHTTEMGAMRIKRNLDLQTADVVSWCKEMVVAADIITMQGFW